MTSGIDVEAYLKKREQSTIKTRVQSDAQMRDIRGTSVRCKSSAGSVPAHRPCNLTCRSIEPLFPIAAE
jgi:hypothetical protein